MKELAKELVSYLDYTSLSILDNEKSIDLFLNDLSFLKAHATHPAAVCVFPKFANQVRKSLTGTGVKIAVVNSSFPHSQSSLDSKLLDIKEIIKSNVDEVDIVFNLGAFLNGELTCPDQNILKIKEELKDVTLKVILETGIIKNEQDIYNASILALESGADFIKTSTGKEKIGATPEAVVVMCRAIRDYYQKTGEAKGIKISGGVRTFDDALLYREIIKTELGKNFLTPKFFRIGASSLLKDLKKYLV